MPASAVPPVLMPILHEIVQDSRTDLAGGWTRGVDGRWSLKIVARLSVPATDHIASETGWHVVVGEDQPTDGVAIYPDRVDGVTATFRHQDYNRNGESDLPWRLGKPCLDRPIAAFGRDSGDEPMELGARLSWTVGRLLVWIDATASGGLAAEGDPLELPARPTDSGFPVIGFNETVVDLPWWDDRIAQWGIAELTALPGSKDASAITKFFDAAGETLRAIPWGSWYVDDQPAAARAIWIRLRAIPVCEPWRLPATWRELGDLLAADGIDLAEILGETGIAYRSSRRAKAEHKLLLGFPLAQFVGGEAARMHWLGVGGVMLSHRDEKRDGFRPIEENRRFWDRSLAQSSHPLVWLRTMNWAPDQLRARGGAEDAVRTKRILIVGAGALGSAVAENLLRMGATDLGILDNENFDVGNLCRHVLGMSSVGHPKASAMAKHLNEAMPDARVAALVELFPPKAKEVADRIRSYDVIVDCTASDQVLDEMAAFDWQGEKLFVSLSMTWRSLGLLAYSASEAAFPAIDAKIRFRATPAAEIDPGDVRIEGIGCWHPVFPAAADDVQLWAAIGCKYIRNAIVAPGRRCDHYRQKPDGTVERLDA